jgi:hypothetical protein
LGENVTASGPGSIAMGSGSLAAGESSFAVGRGTIAQGPFSAAFGDHTTALGSASVALGSGSLAEGDETFAFGNNVRARNPNSIALGHAAVALGSGSFVFGDASSDVNVAATPDQFVARAAGGVIMYSNQEQTSGVRLAPGGGAWLTVSDVNMKEHFRDLDGDDVLSTLARMPVREWSYKAQGAATRHVGPTAQDFRAAFGLGEDPLRIGTVDADGIALRAIQALEARTRAENARLTEEGERLARVNAALRARVNESARRLATIATLEEELAALRAEIAALREVRR